MPFRKALTALLICVPALPSSLDGQASVGIERYLRAELGFNARDLRSLRRGRVVTRLVDTGDPREIAVATAVRVPASVERFMAEVADAARWMSGRTITQARSVAVPASPADFDDLTLPEGDLEDLEHCRPGDCRVKLPESVMAEIALLDWSQAMPRQAAQGEIREMFLGLADRFRAGQPLPAYADKRALVDPRAGFRSIINDRPYLLQHLPQLRQRVLQFPEGPEMDASDTLVWMEERFGLKPVLSLNNVMVYRPRRSGAVDVLMTLEQLYGSHYFEASASMMAFVEGEQAPGSWLVYIRHHRFDATLNTAQRRLIENQIRTYVGDFIAERSARLENPPA